MHNTLKQSIGKTLSVETNTFTRIFEEFQIFVCKHLLKIPYQHLSKIDTAKILKLKQMMQNNNTTIL